MLNDGAEVLAKRLGARPFNAYGSVAALDSTALLAVSRVARQPVFPASVIPARVGAHSFAHET